MVNTPRKSSLLSDIFQGKNLHLQWNEVVQCLPHNLDDKKCLRSMEHFSHLSTDVLNAQPKRSYFILKLVKAEVSPYIGSFLDAIKPCSHF